MKKTPDEKSRHAAIPPPPADPDLTVRRQSFHVSALADRDNEGFEVKFYENVLAEDPCNEEVLMLLGHTYTRRGDYGRGLELDRRLARLRPRDPTAFYNLACSYSLLHQTDDAYTSLEKAIVLGYRDLKHILKDPDLQHLREDPKFLRFVGRFTGKHANNS